MIFFVLSFYYRIPTNSPPKYLCDGNFTEELKGKRNTIIFFKSETCPYCKEFAPTYDYAAHLYGHKGSFYISNFNKCHQVSKYFNVTSFPTVISSKYMRLSSHCGRSVKAIHNFIKKEWTSPGIILNRDTELISLLDKNTSFFISNHELTSDEKYLIDQINTTIVFYSDKNFNLLRRHVPLSTESQFLFYRSADREFLEITDFSVAGIDKFINENTNPNYIPFSTDIVSNVFVDGALLVLVRLDISRDEFGNNEHALMKQLEKGGVKIIFFTNEHKPIFDDLISPPDSAAFPIISMIKVDSSNPVRWLHKGTCDPLLFIQSVISGKEEPYVKSEDIPKDNSGPIKVFVGKTFQKEVIESSKPVFVLFYNGNSYAVDALTEKLGDLQNEYENYAKFGIIDLNKNEIPFQVKEKTPVIGVVKNGDLKLFGLKEKGTLQNWAKKQISVQEL